MLRNRILFFVMLTFCLMLNASHVFGQGPSRLQIIMIGQEQGASIAPAGQTTELKLEILNGAPGDIFLVQGDAYLDPELSGAWVIVHSENLGNFHLSYLESALWAFNLDMPAKIRAENQTNGLPQVVLMIQVTYSAGTGLMQTQRELFALGVPGASVGPPSGLSWVAGVAVVIVLVATVLAYRAYRKNRW